MKKKHENGNDTNLKRRWEEGIFIPIMGTLRKGEYMPSFSKEKMVFINIRYNLLMKKGELVTNIAISR